MDVNKTIREWYFNEDSMKRKFILFEMLKEIRSHSTDLIGIDSKPLRFQSIGSFTYLIKTFIPSIFVQRKNDKGEIEEVKNPRYQFFRSIQYIRFTDETGKKANIKTEFNKLTYGWDLILDFDNKLFKGWYLNNPTADYSEIIKKVEEGIQQPYQEAKKVKEFLDLHNTPYILNFTGSGFRIAIYWQDLKNYFSYDDYGVINKKIGRFIVNTAIITEPQTFDSSTLGYGMGLTRVLFSIHPITLLICYPLSDEEFEKFNLDIVKPQNILDNIGKTIKPKVTACNKRRAGDLQELYTEFRKNYKVDKYEIEKEKKKVTIQQDKTTIIELFNGLPERDKLEALAQIKVRL